MEIQDSMSNKASNTVDREAQNGGHSPLSLQGEGGLGGRESLILFDFDGTLTTRDTLIAFIRYVHGTRRTLAGFLRYLPQLVMMKLHLYPNWKAKQKIFTHFFAGMSLDNFNNCCRRFAADNHHLLRPQGLATLRQALDAGAQVMVVSASIDNWVAPFFTSLFPTHSTPLSSPHSTPHTTLYSPPSTASSHSSGPDGNSQLSTLNSQLSTLNSQLSRLLVVGTQIEVVDGKITGRFLTPNCYGPEKVHRVEALLSEPRDHYHITAYGDSRGDKEMLQYADERHYKPFR